MNLRSALSTIIIVSMMFVSYAQENTVSPVILEATTVPTVSPAILEITSVPTVSPVILEATTVPTVSSAILEITSVPIMQTSTQTNLELPSLTPSPTFTVDVIHTQVFAAPPNISETSTKSSLAGLTQTSTLPSTSTLSVTEDSIENVISNENLITTTSEENNLTMLSTMTETVIPHFTPIPTSVTTEIALSTAVSSTSSSEVTGTNLSINTTTEPLVHCNWDIDNDNTITVIDLQLALDLIETSDERDLKRLDLNNDGVANLVDIQLSTQFLYLTCS